MGDATVDIWGTGRPLREFLHVDDLADALVHLLKVYSGPSHVNIGTGEEISIKELAHTIASVVGYQGRMNFDVDKPDGAPRKLLDSRIMKDLGWISSIRLDDGIKETYEWFLATQI